MTDALILMVIMSVPLTAILSRAVLRWKELDGAPRAPSGNELRRIADEHEELRKRIEVLETIVTSETGGAPARARVAPGLPTARSAEPESLPASEPEADPRRAATRR